LCVYFKTYLDSCYFFFQAEDGIRDDLVTGVQTCALPIYATRGDVLQALPGDLRLLATVRFSVQSWHPQVRIRRVRSTHGEGGGEIGRASCRERVEKGGVGGWVEKGGKGMLKWRRESVRCR